MEKYDLGLIDSASQKKKIENSQVSVELAAEKDWQEYKSIRLEAVRVDPKAFSENPGQILKEEERLDPEWKKDLLDNTQIIVLSKYDSRAVGIVKGVKMPEEGVWSVQSVYVNPDFRKSATSNPVSEEMLEKVLDEIKKRGGILARLRVRTSRSGAIHLFEDVGFAEIAFKKKLSLMGGKPALGWRIMEEDLTKS